MRVNMLSQRGLNVQPLQNMVHSTGTVFFLDGHATLMASVCRMNGVPQLMLLRTFLRVSSVNRYEYGQVEHRSVCV